MPFYDYVYGTMDKKSDPLHASSWKGGRLATDEKADVVSSRHNQRCPDPSNLLSKHVPMYENHVNQVPSLTHDIIRTVRHDTERKNCAQVVLAYFLIG